MSAVIDKNISVCVCVCVWCETNWGWTILCVSGFLNVQICIFSFYGFKEIDCFLTCLCTCHGWDALICCVCVCLWVHPIWRLLLQPTPMSHYLVEAELIWEQFHIFRPETAINNSIHTAVHIILINNSGKEMTEITDNQQQFHITVHILYVCFIVCITLIYCCHQVCVSLNQIRSVES